MRFVIVAVVVSFIVGLAGCGSSAMTAPPVAARVDAEPAPSTSSPSSSPSPIDDLRAPRLLSHAEGRAMERALVIDATGEWNHFATPPWDILVDGDPPRLVITRAGVTVLDAPAPWLAQPFPAMAMPHVHVNCSSEAIEVYGVFVDAERRRAALFVDVDAPMCQSAGAYYLVGWPQL